MAGILVTATPKEMYAALDWAGGLPRLVQGEPAPVRIGGRDWLLLVCGVGPLNAALHLGRLLGRHAGPTTPGGPIRLDGIVNLGIGGSFDLDQLPLGSVAVVEREIWPEYGLRTEAGVDARGLGFALFEPLGPPVPPVPRGEIGFAATIGTVEAIWDSLDLSPDGPAGAAKRLGLPLDPTWTRCASLSVAGVTAEPSLAARLHDRYGALLENMEGFSLAYGCVLQGLPFLELRVVSNRVGSRRPEDWGLAVALRTLGIMTRRLLLDRE